LIEGRGLLDSAAVLEKLAPRRISRVILSGAFLLAVHAPECAWGATATPGPNPKATGGARSGTKPAGSLDRATDGATRDVVEHTQARYDATRNFVAAFEQELRVESGAQVIRSNGKVYFAKPGRMRWEYVAPEPQTIVADGSFLWIDQPKDQQVLKMPFREAFQSQTPVSFLLGVGRLERDFASIERLPTAEDGSLRLRLKPKAESAGGVGDLVLQIDPVTFDIRGATVTDALGNQTRLALSDVRRNQELDDALFRFKPPAGADVIEAPAR
jgi:outer membrane lipoprotein carrier protein